MLHPKDIREMEAKLSSLGISVDTLCERSGIARTTWWRWRERRVSPNMAVWDTVVETFNDMTSPSIAKAS